MPRELLAKSYEPNEFEQKWYGFWEKEGFFLADADSKKPRFSIVIPPPNVTGSLHMGHALQHTLHDILVRWKRMSGFNTLWLPGTDHASIAVHYVLDKQMEEEKKSRFDLGRDRFPEARLGVEKDRAAARFSTRCGAWAFPATGAGSDSRWTNSCRAPSWKFSSGCTKKG